MEENGGTAAARPGGEAEDRRGGDPGDEVTPGQLTNALQDKLDAQPQRDDPQSPAGPASSGDDQSRLFESDEFRMNCMKVLPCNKGYRHDWTVCPYVHEKEKARRRPLTCNYTGIACPEMKKFAEATERMGTRAGSIRAGTGVSDTVCPRGDVCPYAHNVFEYWLHPTRYRTQMCNDGARCNRNICFFAHCPEQIRVPKVKPFVSPEMLAQATMDAQRKKAAAAKESQANVQSWMEMLLGNTGAHGAPLSLPQLAQIAAFQSRPQPGPSHSLKDRQQMHMLLEALQQANSAQNSLPALQAAMLRASFPSMDDRQGLDAAYRSSSEPHGFGHPTSDFARTLSAAQMQQGMATADFRAAAAALGMSTGADPRTQFRMHAGLPGSQPYSDFGNVGSQGLDLSALGGVGLGAATLGSPTHPAYDFLPQQSQQQFNSQHNGFRESLNLGQGMGEGTPRGYGGAPTGPPPEWDCYRGLGSPTHADLLPRLDYSAGEGSLNPVQRLRDSVDSAGSSRSRRTSQESSRSNTSYHDAASRQGSLAEEMALRRLSIDSSFAPSRMSLDSNASYMVAGEGPPRASTSIDKNRLSFDDSFQRMSLDQSHYSGSLGHQPLETVSERQELEARMYSMEPLGHHPQQAVSPVGDSAYRTALNSSFFGSSAGTNGMFPMQQYRSTADSPYGHSSSSCGLNAPDWKMAASDLARQQSQNSQLPPRMPSPVGPSVTGYGNDPMWQNIRHGQ